MSASPYVHKQLGSVFCVGLNEIYEACTAPTQARSALPTENVSCDKEMAPALHHPMHADACGLKLKSDGTVA
jgi:hypothetical protein